MPSRPDPCTTGPADDRVWVLSPGGVPDADVVVAAARAGALGILDLGVDASRAAEALADIARRRPGSIGVRTTPGRPIDPASLPPFVTTVVVDATQRHLRWDGRRVVVEVRSDAELAALLDEDPTGLDGVLLSGAEAAGRVGTTGTMVLVQQARRRTPLPLWARGGIDEHTAAAAVVGGATGVVLDDVVALTRESNLAPATQRAIAAMDGTEAKVVAGHRIYVRPDLWVARAEADTDADAMAARLGDRLDHDALPIGQQAAQAAVTADRHRTVGRVVQAVRAGLATRPALAAELAPLAPGSAMCEVLGTPMPIVQGPMTRVSDQPRFASDVAAGGGLPFLALSLLSGAEVRDLLEATAELLGDRPWGVGILGFVPKELRDEQLAVVRDVGPAAALIAGGRPSQAAPLEEAGIATFLHVPSPGLLDRFIKEGARRFVFEGNECGGHVGPRTSFALWGAQVEALLASGQAGECSVLFAGGIHDATSAAMVSTLAAPLAATGAAVGVVMGTAYLFTAEAVTSGAITPTFQAEALACGTTSLLETGPGHLTRCAATAYVDRFEAERHRLIEEGADHTTRWATLEQLNLGRLRLAAKGVTRDGDQLIEVGPDEQRAEGLFMVGDVAALHDDVTTIAELHHAVSDGAGAVLERWQAPTADRVEEAAPADVAIVGMACVMPGAEDLAAFWSNVVDGVDAVTEVPDERWDVARYFDPDYDPATAQRSSEVRSSSRWGGFVPDVAFDALAFGIPPASLASIEPMQLLTLKAAADALDDTGWGPDGFDRSRTSVVVGAEGGTDQSTAYGLRALLPTYFGDVPAALDEFLPTLTEDSFPGILTNVIAGRVANRLDLGGKNFTVDAACASSLAALDVACTELTSGTSDVVLCGGVDLHNGVHDYLLFSSVHALSPTGRCRTFSADADGIALGEGVACLVLKRLADAERDGDRIYAVVKAVAGSSDGRSLGLTAPRQEGQERALRRAYALAGVSPAEVGLVEAHGTGTVVGDRTELRTLTEVFTEARQATAGASDGDPDRAPVVLGSVKSTIGHTKCAAGLAGVIKAALALHHRVQPPTANISTPNEAWDPEASPFVFLDRARPWVEERRVAGVSAFGFGGTNYHAVLSAHVDAAPPVATSHLPTELVLVRGDDASVAAQLDELASRLADLPLAADAVRLRDVAAAVTRAGRGPVRVAMVVDDLPDLRRAVEQARRGEAGDGVHLRDADADADEAPPRLAFLYPGQGSQRPGMLTDVLTRFTDHHGPLAVDPTLTALLAPPAAFDAEERAAQAARLTDTRVAQPALGVVEAVLTDVLADLGITPDAVAGHSYGELVALRTAGVLDDATLVALSRARADAMLGAAGDDPGAMVAVGTGADDPRLADVLDATGVVLANDNQPRQVVLAGTTPAIDAAVEQLVAAGLATKRLPVACAFHSPVVAAAEPAFLDALAEAGVGAPGPDSPQVWSNAAAAPYPADPDDARRILAAQLASPVRFREQIEAMHDAGIRTFVEVGPGRVLTGLVRRILGDRPHRVVACDEPGRHGVRSLLEAVAALAVAGAPVDVDPLHDGRDVDAARWTDPARPAGWIVNGHLVRTKDASPLAGGLRPATEAPQLTAHPVGDPLVGGVGGGATAFATTAFAATGVRTVAPAALSEVPVLDPTDPAAGLGPAEHVVLGYLQATTQALAAQRDVVLGYLGAPAPAGEHEWAAAPSAAVASTATPAATPVTAPAAVPASADVGLDAASAAATAAGLPDPADASPSAPGGAELLRSVDALLGVLTDVVSARTGYPPEMLDPDLDVEADLSIDSIKRIEILGELAEGLGLTAGGAFDQLEDLVEDLATRKTLRSIAEWLTARADDLLGTSPALASDAPPAEADVTEDQHVAATPGATPAPADDRLADDDGDADTTRHQGAPRPSRHLTVALADCPASDGAPPVGHSIVVTGDGPVAAALVAALRTAGAEAQVRAAGDLPRQPDVVVLTDLLDPHPPATPDVVLRLAGLLAAGATTVVLATPLGGGLGIDPVAPGDGLVVPVGAGCRGLVKTAALEHPDRVVRLVDLDPSEAPAVLADHLLCELGQDGPVETAWRDGRRRTTELRDRPRRPAADLPLDRDAVVLLTGGARGITATVAVALAQATGCHLEIVGRTPLHVGEEDPALADRQDQAELTRGLIELGWRDPRAIDKECRAILSGREVRATLAALAEAGAPVTYHQVDVRDDRALAELVADVRRRHGRLDAIVHGAGVLADGPLVDKEPADVARVWATKVEPATTLLGAIDDSTAVVVLFGSIAGVVGNKGQADYAAANDALDALAAAHPSGRVLSIDWGPWGGGAGMVSPGLAALFASQGIGLVAPTDGAASLLELVGDPERPAQVVVAAVDDGVLGGRPGA